MGDERKPLLSFAESSRTRVNSGSTSNKSVGGTARGVHVRNLSYTVQPGRALDLGAPGFGLFGSSSAPPPRLLLDDVSFDVAPGQLMGILGGSGSGKTTLLDLLACRQDAGTREGSICVGADPASRELHKRIGGYVVQEDRLLPSLTVRETLLFVCNMKTPASWSDAKRLARVEAVIGELGLRHVADTQVGGSVSVRGISGGERRRVSIAAQLILDPAILLLDEPTSGLDAFTAFYICQTLQLLAHRGGRTVVATIHTPRSNIVYLFDRLMLLSQGRMAYYGTPQDMPEYFGAQGHVCPENSNPCDFYLDLVTINYRSRETERRTREVVDRLVKHHRASAADVAEWMVVLAEELPAQQQPEDDANEPKKEADEVAHGGGAEDNNSPGPFRQFMLLTARSVKNQLKDRDTILLETVQGGVMSLVIGTVFYKLGDDQIAVSDRFGCLYIITSLYLFMVLLSTIAQVNAKRPSFYLERLDGLYDLEPYMLAELVSELPFFVVFALTYTMPAYFMSGLQLDMTKIVLFNVALFLGIYGSRSFATAVASGIVRFQQAALVANLLYTLLNLPSGFLFNVDDIWIGLRWLNSISYMAFAFRTAAVNEFDGLVFQCPDYQQFNLTCPVSTGEEALDSFALEDTSITFTLLYALGFCVFCRALQYLFLRFVDQRPRS